MYIDNVYCLIKIIQKKFIELYIIKSKVIVNNHAYNYPLCFIGINCNLILKLLSLHDNLSLLSFNHALYIGKELYKAEISLIINQIYIQD